MTITTQPARNEYTANAGQTVFNYTFKIFSSTDLNVYVTPAGAEYDDSLYLTTDYVVDPSGIGDEDGGFITLNTPTNQDDRVTIVLDVPSSRTTDYQNNGDFRPDTVNADFDRVVSIAKKVEDLTNRAVLLEQSTQGPKPLTLEEPIPNAVVGWNSDGTGLKSTTASIDDLERATEYVDFLEEYTEDDVPTAETPEGKTVTTIYGQNLKVDEAIDDLNDRADDIIEQLLVGTNVILPPIPYGSGFIVETVSGPNEYPVNQGVEQSGVVVRFAGQISELPYDLSQPYDSSKWSLVSATDAYIAGQLSKYSPANIGWDVDFPMGNKITNKCSGGMRFSRASSATYENKSGELVTVPEDYPAITSDGISIYESVTNEALWSEDFSNAVWDKTGLLTVSQDGTLAPDGISQAWKFDFGGSTGQMRQLIASQQETAIASFWVKGTAGETMRIEARAANASVVSQVQYTLSGGWERLDSFKSNIDWSVQSSQNIYISIRKDSGNTADVLYAWGGMATKGIQFVPPYIKTEAASVTRAPDIATIPMKNNMPAAGQPFTIVMDCAVPLYTENTNSLHLLTMGVSGSFMNIWRFNGIASNVAFRVFNGQGGSVVSRTTVAVDDAIHRYVFTFDGSQIDAFVDGVGSGNPLACNAFYEIGDIYLGQSENGNRAINSEIKNFRIIHRALSGDEIIALGGPDV